MRNFGLMFAFLVVSSAASCYNVNYGGLTFRCDPAQSGGAVCPDGYECDGRQNLCVPTGSGMNMTSDLGMEVDLFGTPPDDLRGIPGQDLSSSPTGCSAGNGTDVTSGGVNKVWACPGTFSSMGKMAGQLCSTGFALCTTGTNADLAKCGTVSGFFLASVYGVVDNQGNNMLTCNQANVSSGFNRTWYGCGTGFRSTTNACSNWRGYLDCGSPGMFTCGNGANLNNVSNSSATNGVLCCSP